MHGYEGRRYVQAAEAAQVHREVLHMRIDAIRREYVLLHVDAYRSHDGFLVAELHIADKDRGMKDRVVTITMAEYDVERINGALDKLRAATSAGSDAVRADQPGGDPVPNPDAGSPVLPSHGPDSDMVY